MTEDFMLGDGLLHQRLCAITEILGKFVASAASPLSIAQLAEVTERSEAEVQNFCAGLARAALLRPHPSRVNSWELACAPDKVTLEDVFRCVMAEQPATTLPIAPSALPAPRPQRLQRDADLLVMQAAMAINQSVFLHLRQFSLDRLKFSAAPVFSSPRTSRGVSAVV
jgi:DNA-binding IscR family transcriptional regulator